MASIIDHYNELMQKTVTLKSEIIANKKTISNLQNQRNIIRKNQRETNVAEYKQHYQTEIDNINSQIKILEKEVKDLNATMDMYNNDIHDTEVKIAQMYTPVTNTITIQTNNSNSTVIQGNAPSLNQTTQESILQGKSYDDINGMADAYAGLNSAADFYNALNSEDRGNLYKSIYHSANLFSEKETDLIHNRYRYGVLNAYQTLTTSKEYLFFTKPDLNIVPSRLEDGTTNYTDSIINIANGLTLNDLHGVLRNYPFWTELIQRYPGVIECLESSIHIDGRIDPFNHLLANMVQSNIDVPGLSAEMTETATNMYGVGYTYRGSSEASDDGFDFSLEFKDTKHLPVYNFFKAYEEYETLKHHGVIGPWIGYIYDKVLHDQYSIYKFVVGDDGETIIYYAKYYGVKSKSLPRDVFNSNSYDNGLSYSVDFNAAFVEDMNPLILSDFNKLSFDYWNSKKNFIDVYDFRYDKVDNRAANAAIVVRETNGRKGYEIIGTGHDNEIFYDNIDTKGDGNPKLHTKEPGGYCYKLKWKGDASV